LSLGPYFYSNTGFLAHIALEDNQITNKNYSDHYENSPESEIIGKMFSPVLIPMPGKLLAMDLVIGVAKAIY
jgi:hypothetical protein